MVLSSAYRKGMCVKDWSFWHQMRKLGPSEHQNYLILKWSQASELEEEMSAGSCQLSSPSGAMNTVRMNETFLYFSLPAAAQLPAWAPHFSWSTATYFLMLQTMKT